MEFEVLTVRAKVQTCANHIITISVKPPRARQPEQRFCNSMLLYSCHSYPLIHASPHTKALRAQTSDQGTVIIKLIKTEGAHHQSSPESFYLAGAGFLGQHALSRRWSKG